ncbi:hypothetical protein [Pseudomonas sp. CGJS7]|uniref:hypothetical protein n=1 Tax=Pseudomonas sp. CGJS7 TaxID=3109348 RepID=UPI0030093073
MHPRLIDHAWILLTVAFATYSQLIMKWRMSNAGPLPSGLADKLLAVLQITLQPWVLSALLATFLSGLCWMVALTKFELNYAFPFTALNFLIIYLAGTFIFGEHSSAGRLIGTVAVLVGVLLIVVSNSEPK